MMDLFHLLSSQDVNWWTGVVWITCGLLWCFYRMFGLSFWRHPFTAEDPLVRKWWNATFLQIWWRNKLVCISDGLRVSKCSSIFPFLDELFLEWLNRGFRHENHTHRCKQHRGGDHCYMIWTELLINRGVVKGHLITAALVSRRVHKHTHTHI